MTGLSALRYPGGKSVLAATGTGRWIASLLPWSKKSVYVEPFAGMLGVLLQRAPVDAEIVNDLDDRVYRWWTCLRDHTDEVLRLILFTPRARAALVEAVAVVDDPGLSCCHRSAAFSTILIQSVNVASPCGNGSNWRRGFKDTNRSRVALIDRLAAVAERIADVQIDNRDAVELLDRVAGIGDAVVYVDPPYRDVTVPLYATDVVDVDALTDALRAQSGRVAISGYGDEWDHLGWRRLERDAAMSMAAPWWGPTLLDARTEVLWTNFDPPGQGSLL